LLRQERSGGRHKKHPAIGVKQCGRRLDHKNASKRNNVALDPLVREGLYSAKPDIRTGRGGGPEEVASTVKLSAKTHHQGRVFSEMRRGSSQKKRCRSRREGKGEEAFVETDVVDPSGRNKGVGQKPKNGRIRGKSRLQRKTTTHRRPREQKPGRTPPISATNPSAKLAETLRTREGRSATTLTSGKRSRLCR